MKKKSVIRRAGKSRPIPPKELTTNPASIADISIRFGKRMRHLRLNLNVRQEDMAAKLGIGRNYLSAVENGTKSPSLNFLYIFALGFNISLSELMKGL